MPSQHKQPSACQRLFTGRQGPPGQRIVRPPWPSWRNSISRPPSSSHQCSPSRSTRMLQLRKGPAASLHFSGTSNEVVSGDSGDRPAETAISPVTAISPQPAITALAAIGLITAITLITVITPITAIDPITAITLITAINPITLIETLTAGTPATSH